MCDCFALKKTVISVAITIHGFCNNHYILTWKYAASKVGKQTGVHVSVNFDHNKKYYDPGLLFIP